MLAKLQQRFRSWAFRRTTESGSITLNQRRIYILPTRRGLGFALVLGLMLLGNINYNLSLGYMLTFLLTTAGSLTMLHAFRNMAQLEVRAGRVDPVFAGEAAGFRLHFHNRSALSRYQLTLHDTTGHQVSFDLPANQDSEVMLNIPALQRGWLSCDRLGLYTEFPLGLFHAWSYLNFDVKCLVYPKPVTSLPLPSISTQQGEGKLAGKGDDDFAGLRDYAPGDALQRIAWKALAREQGLQIKQFSAPQGRELCLDWALLPATDVEQKLSMLTRWVIDADKAMLQYSMRLPGVDIPSGSGSSQREICLRELALYRHSSASHRVHT